MRIGIDLGGTKIEGIVLDTSGKQLIRLRRPTPAAQGYAAILSATQTLIQELEQHIGQTCTVGIGTPGAISTRTGRLKNSNTVCLNDMPIQEDIEHLLQRPVRLANDANCFALCEAVEGAGKDYAVVFGVILGTGVGGGIVIQRQLHTGLQNIAGEWGHNMLEPDGPACYCGKRGCIETLLSGPGLALDYAHHGGAKNSHAQEIVQRDDAGDTLAEQALQRYSERLAHALSMVINILDPDAIVLGGGMSNITRLYTEVPQRLLDYIFNDEVRTPILPNQHGDSAGVHGAAWLWD